MGQKVASVGALWKRPAGLLGGHDGSRRCGTVYQQLSIYLGAPKETPEMSGFIL